MQIIRRYMHNPLRNFNYLIGCEVSGQAIALETCDADIMQAMAVEQGWVIRLIINTQEQHDHVQGNLALQALTNAPVWAHENARVPGQSPGIKPGDEINLGSIQLRALHTP